MRHNKTGTFIKILTATSLMLSAVSCQLTDKTPLLQPEQRMLSSLSSDQVHSLSNDGKKLAMVRERADKLRTKEIAPHLEFSRHYNLAQMNLWLGHWNEALEDVQNAIAIAPSEASARRTQAQVFFRQGKLELAELVLIRLEDELWKDAEALNLMALITYRRGEASKALQFFKKALEIQPNHLAARLNLGSLYLTYKQLHPAAVQYERALKIDPKNLDAKLHLAIAQHALGTNNNAESIYADILYDHPKHPIALFNLAMVRADQEKYAKAIALLKEYLETELAKNTNNKDVFNLIHEFEKHQLSQKAGPTDAEIQKMAGGLQTQTSPPQSAVFGSTENTLSPEPTTNSTPSAPTQAPAKPAKAPGKAASKPDNVDADIELLQKELSR
jgi:Tfp pilus assembly protein PilF